MLRPFLDSNRTCPQCETPLHLYMRWTDSLLFKAEKIDQDTYKFVVQIASKEHELFQDGYVILKILDDRFETEFSSPALKNEAKRWKIHFFTVCNPAGIKYSNKLQYVISLYSCCYHSASPMFEFKRFDFETEGEVTSDWRLELSEPEKKLINQTEEWCYFQNTAELEKVYCISMDYHSNHTKIMHYSVTPEQAKTKGWKPNTFKKTLPMLPHRPAITKADWPTMIARFENWILMS